MGQGICADYYVGKPDEQYWFRINFGGSGEYPWEIRKRLDRAKARKEKSPQPTRAERKISYE